MIEYLYDVIRAVPGQPISVSAVITEDGETPITEGCKFTLHDNELQEICSVDGIYLEEEGSWQFEVPAEITLGMNGRYWYCIRHDDINLCFKKPIYLKG